MKLKTITLSIGAALMLSGCTSGRTVTVGNSLPFQRSEMVQIAALELPGGEFVITDAEGAEVPYQILRSGDVIFPVKVSPNAEALYRIAKGAPAPVKPRVYGRMVPEHKDNMNWENDLSAYVAYGPALQAAGERGFGYDIWTKSVDTLVIDLRNRLRDQKISLHKDHGNGMDAYTVANTLGGGTAALLDDSGAIIFPWAWQQYEILENGPLRFSVRLTYGPLKAEEDEEVIETRVITLDQGSDLNRTEISYEGLSSPRKLAPGIVVHEQNPFGFLLDTRRGILAYADSTDNARNGNGVVYVGVIVPDGKTQETKYMPVAEPAKQALGHVLAVTEYTPGDTFEYYWGSAWSKNPTGPASPEEWFARLRRTAACIASPLKVKVKK